MKATEFRRALPDDARALTALARASKQYWGYSEELMELWNEDLLFTPESILAGAVLVAGEEGEIVGVFALSHRAMIAELDHLWIRPSRVGQGLGRTLFRRAVAEARALGAESLRIESDPHAEPFYIRMGASPVGSVPSKPAGRRLPLLVLDLLETSSAT